MKFGIIQFPGSNCEKDCLYVAREVLGLEAHLFDYREKPDLRKLIDYLIIPGGFSFGDYLRAGAIAKASSIMSSIKQFAEYGGLILGICNGFQILTEARLLPGVLVNNIQGRFICQETELKVINANTSFTNLYSANEIIKMPIAHAHGNYRLNEDELKKAQDNLQIVFEYKHNINGSVANIAGICNKQKNILGLMPHPERCCEKELGGVDGLKLFQSLLKSSLFSSFK